MPNTIRTSARRPDRPLRLVLIAILLAGLAGWQGWHCTDGTTASPMTAPHLMADMSAAVGIGHSHTGDPEPSPMLFGACLSVLAAIAGTLVLLAAPRLAALGLVPSYDTPPMSQPWFAVRAPALSQLCISRT